MSNLTARTEMLAISQDMLSIVNEVQSALESGEPVPTQLVINTMKLQQNVYVKLLEHYMVVMDMFDEFLDDLPKRRV